MCNIAVSISRRLFTVRSFCSSAVGDNAEKVVHNALTNRFPKADIKVTDISGGCGAMFEVFVQSNEFAGLNTLKQHKLVTNALKDHIKEMHGVRIHTAVPNVK